MADTLYKGLEKQLSTTDLLAMERNVLAAERTLLAYIRTFLSFVVAGVSLIQFFNDRVFILAGYLFIPLSFIILIVGFIRFSKTKRKIRRIGTV